MLTRLRRAAYVYHRTPKRNLYAYIRRTGDTSFLRIDLVWVITGRGRPRWLPE